MRIKSLATIAAFSVLAAGVGSVATGCSSANPCAGTKTEEVDPCAAGNPCAAKDNPCAAASPCAAKDNPCAAGNPCAAKTTP